MPEKTCTRCGSDGPFWKMSKTKDGLDYWCQDCRRESNSQYKKNNPDKIRELNNKSQKKKLTEEKLATIAAYGGACTCCGETDPHFLTLEHVNGVTGRRKTGTEVFREVKRAGYSNDFTILCFNCNCAKGFFGFCPHQPHEDEQRRYPRVAHALT